MSVLEMTTKESKPGRQPSAPTADAKFLAHPDEFPRRHIGPDAAQTKQMLETLGRSSVDALIDEAVPRQIRLQSTLQLPAGRSEYEVLGELKTIAGQNQVFRSFIGMGYYDC